MKSLETLVASTDMIVVDSESMISMPPELQRQFARVVASSTVKQGGIRMGEPVGKIPPPPTPPPGCVLWVLRKAGSADQGIRKGSALAVVEIYDEFGFAQVIQPGKAAFRLASERWGDIAGSVAELRILGIEGQIPDTRKAEQTKRLARPVRYICKAIENNENQVQVFRLHRKILDERPRKELIALVSDSWKALEEHPKSTDEPDTGPPPLLKPWASLNIHSRKPAKEERRWERETYIQILVYDAPSAVTVTIAIYTGEYSGHYILQGHAAKMTREWVVSIMGGG